MNSVSKQIVKRIRGRGMGSVFTPKDFLDLGSRAAVDQVLSRLTRRGTIRRLGRGLYDYPRVSPHLGPLSPALDEVAKALARRTDSRMQVSGARAANGLGLSTQVPAHLVYVTDGRSQRVRIGRQVITLRHAAPRNMIGAGKTTGTVLQALRYLGKDGVDDAVIQKLTRALSLRDKRALKRDARHAPGWVWRVISRIE